MGQVKVNTGTLSHSHAQRVKRTHMAINTYVVSFDKLAVLPVKESVGILFI